MAVFHEIHDTDATVLSNSKTVYAFLQRAEETDAIREVYRRTRMIEDEVRRMPIAMVRARLFVEGDECTLMIGDIEGTDVLYRGTAQQVLTVLRDEYARFDVTDDRIEKALATPAPTGFLALTE